MPSNLSPDLQDLLNKMLALDPEERLGIPEIRKHPWLSLSPKAGKDITSSTELLTESAPTALPFPYRSPRVRPVGVDEMNANRGIVENLKLLGWKEEELIDRLGSDVFWNLLRFNIS